MTPFRYKGQVKAIQIIPWEEGELGIAVEFDDDNKYMQEVEFHENCFFVAEKQRIRQVLHDLINDVLCLCSEGPDVMRSGEIFAELIKEANKARRAVGKG